jgi:hypothetical protein
MARIAAMVKSGQRLRQVSGWRPAIWQHSIRLPIESIKGDR